MRGYTECLPKIEKPKNKFDPSFLQARCDAIQEYLNIVRSSRGAIFVSQVAGLTFFRFLVCGVVTKSHILGSNSDGRY